MSKCVSCGNELVTGDVHWQQGLCNKCYEEEFNQLKNGSIRVIDNKEQTHLLFVEDGSVDIDNLMPELEKCGVKVIVYRQGSQKPELIKLKE